MEVRCTVPSPASSISPIPPSTCSAASRPRTPARASPRVTRTRVAALDGSYALVGVDGIAVRLARSLDRPLRYFLAKEADGPVLVVADRIDAIEGWLCRARPRRPVPPELHAHGAGAPRRRRSASSAARIPTPTYVRTFTPARDVLPGGSRRDRPALRRRARGRDRRSGSRRSRRDEPIGVCFSGGIDSGAVFLVTLPRPPPARDEPGAPQGVHALAAATGPGPRAGARVPRGASTSGSSSRPIEVDPASLRPGRSGARHRGLQAARRASPRRWRSPSCAASARAIPDWRYLLDGDGGDENLKDYPIEENPELTIRSVVNNLMLYQEGWGVGSIKHSGHYTGGQSRSYARTYAPLRALRLLRLQPVHAPARHRRGRGHSVRRADARARVERLYALKGEIVSRGVRGGHRPRRCPSSRSAASSTGRADRTSSAGAFPSPRRSTAPRSSPDTPARRERLPRGRPRLGARPDSRPETPAERGGSLPAVRLFRRGGAVTRAAARIGSPRSS